MKQMKISHLEVENFKSFRGHHIVGPFTGMTGIIGPNGCGKSNIVDALTFVFEIENARNTHPISNNRQQGSRVDFCSVTVHLIDIDSGRKVFYKKIIYKKKETKFQIDGDDTSKQEYLSSLRRLQIGAHSFMLQGETDKLIKKTPEELADIMERACGSNEHKSAYDEAVKQLKELNDETVQLLSEQKNLRKEDLKQKAISEQTEKYEALNKQIKIVELKVEQSNFFQIDRAILGEMKQMEKTQKLLEERKTQERVIKSTIQAKNIKSKEISKELTKKEQEKETLKAECREIADQLEDQNNKLNSVQSLRGNPELKKNLQDQLQASNTALSKLKESVEKEEIVLKELSSSDNLRNKVENKKIKQNYEEYQELARICNSESLNLQRELKKLQSNLASAAGELNSAQEAQRVQNSHISELDGKAKEAKEVQKQKEKELSEKQASKEIIKANLSKLEDQRKDNLKKIKTIEDQLRTLLSNKQSLEYELDLMEEVRSQDKIIKELQRNKGFFGSFSELIRNSSHRHHELAIKIALGSMLSSLVVDTSQTASLVNAQLSTAGIAKDVMILHHLPNATDDRLCKAMIGNLGEIAVGLVDIDERSLMYENNPELKGRIRDTLRYLLRGKVVCDTVEKAFQLRAKRIPEIYQIITIDGDVISNGSIQVSSSDKEKFSKKDLGTAQNIANIQKKIEAERKQIDKKVAELEQLQDSENEKQYNKLVEQLHTEEQAIELIKAEISAAQEKARKLDEKVVGMSKTIAKSVQVLKLEKITQELEVRVQQIQEKIDTKRNEIFGEFCNKHKINIEEVNSQTTATLERCFVQIERQQERLSEAVSALRAAEEKKIVLEKTIEKYEESRKKYEGMEKEFEVFKQKIEGQRSSKEKKYNQVLAEWNDKQKEQKSIQDEIEQLYQELLSNSNPLNKEIITIKHSIGQLVERKESLWQDCMLRQIDFTSDESKKSKSSRSDDKEEVFNSDQDEDDIENDNQEDIEKDTPQVLSNNFSQSLKQYTQVLSQYNDEKLSEQLLKFGEIKMLNYRHLFEDKDQFTNKRKLQQAQDRGDSLIQSLLDCVDISALVDYQQRLIDELDEFKKKIEEYTSKDLAEGLIGGSSSEEVKAKKEFVKNRLGELALNRKAAEETFKAVKKLRKDCFDEYFVAVQSRVINYYEELTKLKGKHSNSKGAADLIVSNEDEKYKGGISYLCCPPKKAYALNPEKELSGGEKTLAHIALFLAIAQRSPFLILDESEAALDSANTANVLHALKDILPEKQKILVSHHLEVYSACSSLLGATFDRKADTSFTLSFDLSQTN